MKKSLLLLSLIFFILISQQTIAQNCNPAISGDDTVCVSSTAYLYESTFGTFASYLWSDGETTSYVYVPPGNYTLTTTTAFGCFGTASFTVIGQQEPQVSFTTTVNNSNVITVNTSTNVSSAEWNWGDGNYSYGLASNHAYAFDGQYTICLNSTDQHRYNFCEDRSYCTRVIIGTPNTIPTDTGFYHYYNSPDFSSYLVSNGIKVIQNPVDSGFLYSCKYDDCSDGCTEPALLSTDKNGNLLWIRYWDDLGNRDIYDMIYFDSGYVISFGYNNLRSSLGTSNYMLLKIDLNGNQQWSKQVYSEQQMLVPFTDTKFAQVSNYNFQLNFFDTQGNLIDTVEYDQNYYISNWSKTAGGNILLNGYYGDQSPLYHMAMQLDTSGNILWNRTFSYQGNSYSNGKPTEAYNGDLLFPGNYVYGSTALIRGYYLVRLDPDGSLISAYSLPWQGEHNAYVAPNSRIAIASTNYSNDSLKILTLDNTYAAVSAKSINITSPLSNIRTLDGNIAVTYDPSYLYKTTLEGLHQCYDSAITPAIAPRALIVDSIVFNRQAPFVAVYDTNYLSHAVTPFDTTLCFQCTATASIQHTGDSILCSGETLDLNANAGDYQYSWSNGSHSNQITVQDSGTYTLTVSDYHGCTATASIQIVQGAVLHPFFGIAIISGNFCEGDDFFLQVADSNQQIITSYLWDTGETTNQISANSSGTYTVILTDAYGCTTTGSINITMNPVSPAVTITGNLNICAGQTTELCLFYTDNGTGPYTYSWPFGESPDSCITVGAGSYDLYVYNSFGCQEYVQPVTVIENPLPAVNAGTYSPVCIDAGIVTLTGTPSGGTFSGAGVSGSTFDPALAGAGSHDITYSYTDGNGCSNDSTTTIIVYDLPIVYAGSYFDVCIDVSSVSLAGSPSGGTFSGSGVVGNTFIPSTAGAGSHIITYSYINGNTGCSNSDTATIVVNALPIVDAGTYGPFCIDGSTVTLTGTPAGGTFVGTGVTGNTFDPVVAGIGTHTITYYYTDFSTDCNNSATVDIVVNPLPSVNAGTYSPVCIDAGTVTLTGTPSGGTFSGAGVSGSTFDPALAGAGSHDITYSYTDGNGCSNDSTTTIIVYDLPVVDAGTYGPVCIDGSAITLVGTPTGGTFSGAGVTGNIFNPSTAGAGSHTITYTYTNGNTNCTNTSTTTIVVNALPTVTTGGPYGPVCIDGSAITLSGTPTGGTFSGTGVTGNTFDPSTAGAGTYTITYTYTDGNNCTNSATVNIVVNALPTVSAGGPYGPVCLNGVNITLSGTPTGGTFSGAGVTGNTFDPSTAGAGSYTITYTYTDGNNCTNSATTTIVVNPLPTVTTGGPYGPVCIDGSAIALVGTPTGGTFSGAGVTGNTFDPSTAGAGTYTITYTYTDGNNCTNSATTTIVVNPLPTVTTGGPYGPVCIDGSVITLSGTPTGGTFSGTGVTGNIFDPATAGAGTYTITYTYTDGNNCTNSATTTIVVNALPTVTAGGPYGPVCLNGSAITLTGTPTGGTFSGAGVTGNTFDPSTAGAGSHTITYTYSDGNNCTNSATTTIVVNPLPTVTTGGPYGPVCIDGSAITLSGTPTGGTFSGTGVTGNTFDPSTAGAGTYTITYTYSDSNNCTNSATTTIVVNPLPTVTTGGPYGPVCIDGSAITLSGTPTGGTFSGTGVTGNTFDPSTAGAGTYTITYTYTDGNNCTNSATTTIVVNALPTVTAGGPYGPVCLNGSAITLTGTPTGGTFSGTGVTGNTFNPSTAGAGTYTITYTYTDGNNCTNSATTTIVVNPLPTVTTGGPYGPVCIDGSAITLVGSPTGGTFSGTGVTGNTFDPLTAGAGTYTITYTYSDGNNCTNSATTTIVVNPLPTVTTGGPYGPVCIDGSAITLVGTPIGGTFSGTGVTGNIFDPATAGVGADSIIYTYTDGNGCSNSDSTTIIVDTLPVVSAGADTAVCSNGGIVSLGGSPAGGTWSGVNVIGSNFDPTGLSTGDYSLTYTYVNGACTAADSMVMHVDSAVTINAGPDSAVCGSAGLIILNGLPAGGTWSGTNVNGSNFDPTGLSTGDYILTYTYVNGACADSDQLVIHVDSLVNVYAGTYTPLCEGADTMLLNGTPAGGNFSGPNVSNGIFDPTGLAAGDYTITYTYVNGVCTITADTIIRIDSFYIVNATLHGPYCANLDAQLLVGQPAGGTFFGTGVYSNSFYPDTVGVGNWIVYYSLNNQCTDTDSVNIVVNPSAPLAAITGPTQVCNGDSVQLCATITDNGSGPYSYNWNPGTLTDSCILVGGGAYQFTIFNNYGCLDSASFVVMTNPLPPAPVISSDTTCTYITSSASTGNQWYEVTAGIITNAVDSFYIFTANGTYYAIVTDSAGCSSQPSDSVVVGCVGIALLSDDGLVTLYPDPASDEINIQLSSSLYRVGEAINETVYDVTGRLVIKNGDIAASKLHLKIVDLANGIYVIRLTLKDREFILRFEKTGK